MILPKHIIDEYKMMPHGTLKELAEFVGIKSVSNASNIMLGKIGTRVEKISKIKKFIEKRKKLITELSSDDGN